MKRTRIVSLALVPWLLAAAVAQEPAEPPKATPQADPVAPIVAEMRAAEAALHSIRLVLSTSGKLPGGLAVATKGSLRVLRGTHAAVHATVEFSFADGLVGRMDSVQNAEGITIFEDNPAFGELLVRIGPKDVADLEWAGEVLKRSDLPGMQDRRATAPLGSTMVEDLQRHFVLAPDARRSRTDAKGKDEAGVWLVGGRRPGLDVDDPELPIADRVELFVRARDHALLEMREMQGDAELQHIVVDELEVDPELDPATFRVDGRGVALREVGQYRPMWERIQQVLRDAEAKSGEGVVRPSKR